MYTYNMAPSKSHVNGTEPRNAPFEELYARPGFLLRRAHQIAVGIFMQECSAVGLTPPQHSALIAIELCPGLDQAALARAIGFDRATVGQVVEGLEARGLLRRGRSRIDKRRKALSITPAGRKLMRRAARAIQRTSERLLSPLSPGDRSTFMTLLTRLTDRLNSNSRTPVRSPWTKTNH